MLNEKLDPASLERRYTVFSSIDIGEDCPPEARLDFMRSLIPVERNMAAT